MEFTDRDNGLAWQLLAGVYMPISENIDVGLKYRYFHPHGFDFNGEQLGYTGAGSQFRADVSGRFTSHSILASLVYNFALRHRRLHRRRLHRRLHRRRLRRRRKPARTVGNTGDGRLSGTASATSAASAGA